MKPIVANKVSNYGSQKSEKFDATFASFFGSPLFSDVTIVIQNEKYAVHKIILSARNKKIASMIEKSRSPNSIIIDNFNSVDFGVFLQYLYSGKIDSWNINEHILRIATKFEDKSLLDICCRHLARNISKGNVMSFLNVAIETNSETLMKHTSKFIAKYYKEMSQEDCLYLIFENRDKCSAVIDAFQDILITEKNKEKIKTVTPNFEHFFGDDKLSDFEIIVKNTKISAHKLVLASRNKVFATMFQNGGKMKSVMIPDFELKDFKVFIKFLYTAKINPDDINHNVMKIAEKYLDEELQNICYEHLFYS